MEGFWVYFLAVLRHLVVFRDILSEDSRNDDMVAVVNILMLFVSMGYSHAR